MGIALGYFVVGAMFVYLAVRYATGSTVWNPATIIFLLIAAMDIFVGLKYFKSTLQQKSKK